MEAGPNDTGAGVAQQIADLMNERMDHSLKLKMPIKENFEFQEDCEKYFDFVKESFIGMVA